MTALTDDLRRALAPTGTLRAALNLGNRILVHRDATGAPQGITVDLARLLARDLDLPLRLVEFERAGEVSAAAGAGLYDVCFLAVDPERAQSLAFTAPYVQIEGRYLAGTGCAAADAGALVRDRHRVATVEGSAYTLDLRRKPGSDRLVTFPDLRSALQALDSGEVDALAGIGAVMAREAAARPGTRLLDPPFMMIRQAMAMPLGSPAAAAVLRGFVDRLARSGEIGRILERHGVSADCAVLPEDLPPGG